jgi:hypothetical protein
MKRKMLHYWIAEADNEKSARLRLMPRQGNERKWSHEPPEYLQSSKRRCSNISQPLMQNHSKTTDLTSTHPQKTIIDLTRRATTGS